jgi:tetratricopeptide (TPR) repeat protein
MQVLSKTSQKLLVLALLSFSACVRTPQNYFSKANEEFQQGRYEEASINYRLAIQKDPKFVAAYEKLGMCEYAQGRVENAIAMLTHASQLAPQDLEVLENLADVTFNRYLSTNRPQGLYDTVNKMVSQILQKNPNSAVGLRLLATIQYGDGKLKESIATFEKADHASPYDPAVILPLADALRLDNQSAEAERRAVEVITHKPDFAPMYDWLGQFYLSSNRQLDAEKLFQTRVKNYPKDSAAVLALASLFRHEHKDSEAKNLIESLTARTEFPNRYLLAGDFYAGGGDLQNAEKEYKAGATAEPADKNLYLTKLAQVYIVENRGAEALAEVDQAIKNQPDDWEALGMRISLLLDTKEPAQVDEGIELAKAIIKRHPSDSRFSELLGRAYDMKGEKRQAEVYYQQAARLDEQFAAPRLALAEIGKARRDSQSVFRYTEEILSANPKNPHARLLHAWGLINQNDLAAAEQEMITLQEDFPGSYDVKVQMGLLYIAERRTRSAIEIFSKLLETHPGDQRILAGLATAYFQNSSFDAAIQLVQREVKRNPSQESTRFMLGRIAARLGRADIALEQFKFLAANHPDSADYQYELGALYDFSGDKPNAVRSFENASRLDPKDANKLGRLALEYYAAGMLDQADGAYSRSVEMSPADPVLLNNRAYFLAETGHNPEEAVRLAQSALQKNPNNPYILDTLALSYAQKKMGDDALQILQPLVTNYPNEPMFRYHLAMALVLKGEKAAARKELEGSLNHHPSKDDVVKIRALLSKIG